MTAHAAPRPRPIRHPGRRIAAFLGLALLGIGAAVTILSLRPPAVAPVPAGPEAAPTRRPVELRGRVVPVRYARIAPVQNGVLSSVLVSEGVNVGERQELARIDTGSDSIVLLAPYAGTVAKLDYRQGDTVLAGQTVATVGDLSRFQIETLDLDEFLVGAIREGQGASVTFDALTSPPIRAVVARVGLTAQTGSNGDVTFPAVLAFDPENLPVRWGMTVRIRLD